MKGCSFAPDKIREALHCESSNLCTESGIDLQMESHFSDANNLSFANGNNAIQHIEDVITDFVMQGKCVLSLGGDHSITFPILKAYNKKYDKLNILHFDAHPDLYDEFDGNTFSHACPFARIMENGFATRLVQVGIRTLNTHQAKQAEKYNVEIHQMKNLDLSSITKFQNPLYISLDMDGFDPAFAPGVSHHEPGGLTSRQVIDLIQSIHTEVVGADIVEYNPDRDFQNMTAFLAAKMTKEILGKMI